MEGCAEGKLEVLPNLQLRHLLQHDPREVHQKGHQHQGQGREIRGAVAHVPSKVSLMSARGKDTEFFYVQGYRKNSALESMGGFKSKSTNNVASHKVTLDLRSKGNFEEDEQTSNTLLHSAWTLSQAQRFVFVAQIKLVE